MTKRLEFDEVFRVDGYGLLVAFNDGTHAKYTVEELANMRPNRELIEKVKDVSDAKPKESASMTP